MNKVFSISPGARVKSGDKRYKITHCLDLENVLAKEEETGKSQQLRIKDLRPDVSEEPHEPAKRQELSLIEQEVWNEAERWLDLFRPLIEAERRTAEMVKEVADAAGVHISTAYRKLKHYEQTELTTELIPSQSDGGKGKSRLTSDVEAIIQATIIEFYKKGRKRSVEQTYQEVKRRCINAKLKPPHRNTIDNRIKALSKKERDEAQMGPKVAQRIHSTSPGHFPGADWPLAVVQIDHTPVDIELVDDVDRLPIGRPFITVAIDVFSRMVLGFHLSLDDPDSMSVGLCLTHGILPKEAWLESHGISIQWPCWGFMRKIHADNAGEFRGKMLKRACKEYDMDLEWRPVKKPEYGGHIESLLGTFAEAIHSLPGTTFSNPKEKGDYDSEKEAVMTQSQFEEWLTNFIVGVYHQRKHSALGTSPINQFEKGIFGTEEQPGTGLPPRVFDEDRLRLDLMPYETRTIQRYGVEMDLIHYHSGVLNRFVGLRDPKNPKKKPKFIFKRNPRDISVLYFYDPTTKQYLEIPYRDRSRPPISLWELRAVRRRLKVQGVKDDKIDEDLIFKTYEKMRQIEDSAKQETKAARRARSRRAQNSRIPKPKTGGQSHSECVMNDLPDEQLPTIESFEIDDSI
jgi:putative transposase